MKLIFLSITLLLMSASFANANDWSTDDWGQWVGEQMTEQNFSDDLFDQLNQLDGIDPSANNNPNGNKKILPNNILFQLWQLENGQQFIDIDSLTAKEKALYQQWLEQSEYSLESIENLDDSPNKVDIPEFEFDKKETSHIEETPPPSTEHQNPQINIDMEFQREQVRLWEHMHQEEHRHQKRSEYEQCEVDTKYHTGEVSEDD